MRFFNRCLSVRNVCRSLFNDAFLFRTKFHTFSPIFSKTNQITAKTFSTKAKCSENEFETEDEVKDVLTTKYKINVCEEKRRIDQIVAFYRIFRESLLSSNKPLKNSEKEDVLREVFKRNATIVEESFKHSNKDISENEEICLNTFKHLMKNEIEARKVSNSLRTYVRQRAKTGLVPSYLSESDVIKLTRSVMPKHKVKKLNQWCAEEIVKHIHVDSELTLLKIEDFRHLIKESSDEWHIQKVINVFNFNRDKTLKTPTILTVEDMQDLMKLPRNSIVEALIILAMKEVSSVVRRWKGLCNLFANGTERYVPGLFSFPFLERLHLTKDSIKLYKNCRFAQPLVFDFSYEKCCSEYEAHKLCKGVFDSFVRNKRSKNPFNFWLCNYKHGGLIDEHFRKQYHGLFWKFTQITSDSYLNIFPKEKLIYLSPDSENVLEYDHDHIYIIGGIVDCNMSPLMSYKKATGEGIATARIPIKDMYKITMYDGLPLAFVTSILNKLKETNDWHKAFEEIPSETFIQRR